MPTVADFAGPATATGHPRWSRYGTNRFFAPYDAGDGFEHFIFCGVSAMSTFVKVTDRDKGQAFVNADLIRMMVSRGDGTTSILFHGDDGVAISIEETVDTYIG